jgi:GWxTD domain-containing protein
MQTRNEYIRKLAFEFFAMKQKILFLLLVFLALQQAEAKKLSAFFSYGTFYAPQQGPYLETYLSVQSPSVNYKLNENNLYQAKVEVLLTVKKNEKIIYFDKYNLYSPEIKDTLQTISDFLDQQRIKLSEGSYELMLSLTDKNSNDKAYEVTQKIDVAFPENKVSISDIEFIDSYTTTASQNNFSKNGYDLIPRTNNYFGRNDESLTFYVEIYNTDKISASEPWLINYYVSEFQKQGVMADLAGFSRQQPVPLKGYIAQIPLSVLPTGNYELNIEVKSKANEVLASRKLFFQRNSGNKIQNADAAIPVDDIQNTFAYKYIYRDTLKEYVNSLYPIANPVEKQFIDDQLASADVPSMQHFLYNFWYRRNKINPEASWLSYNEEVKKVNEEYSTRIQKGYKTERGRVYLQYGPPNSIARYYTEPSAYPYEIWHYYKLENQSNRKFVFINRNTATNDFELLHSDAKGEVYEPRWEMMLHERDTQSGGDWDVEKVPDHLGSHSDDQYELPK